MTRPAGAAGTSCGSSPTTTARRRPAGSDQAGRRCSTPSRPARWMPSCRIRLPGCTGGRAISTACSNSRSRDRASRSPRSSPAGRRRCADRQLGTRSRCCGSAGGGHTRRPRRVGRRASDVGGSTRRDRSGAGTRGLASPDVRRGDPRMARCRHRAHHHLASDQARASVRSGVRGDRLALRGSLAYAGDELAPTPAAPILPERIGDGLNPLTMR